MKFLYTLLIRLYVLVIRLAKPFNKKAKQWIDGRKTRVALPESFRKSGKRIWFHCASLGEFEQGRPVMESIRQQFPDIKIILTFFSPSGYEIRKNYAQADIVLYLPADIPARVKGFLNTYQPDIAIFIKYEFWFNYLNELYKRDIPVVFASAIFRPSQHFFKWYGGWFRKYLRNADRIFVQDANSLKLLESIGLVNAVKAGDTRFDRVFENAVKPKRFSLIEKFKGDSKIVLGGSTWPPEIELLGRYIREAGQEVKYIIAPHEVDPNTVNAIRTKLGGDTVLYSEAEKVNLSQYRILIIDGIGFLSHLYQYADIAVIGGGFGKGIHNILEAATFGVPVIFGPNYLKFREAVELKDLKGAFSVNDFEEFKNTLSPLLKKFSFRKETGEICRKYVQANTGATRIITQYIRAKL